MQIPSFKLERYFAQYEFEVDFLLCSSDCESMTSPTSWHRPQAGPIAFPRLIGEDVERFCDRLVREASVLLLPGTVFDDRENHFRIGFGRRNVPQALARLEEFLAHPRPTV